MTEAKSLNSVMDTKLGLLKLVSCSDSAGRDIMKEDRSTGSAYSFLSSHCYVSTLQLLVELGHYLNSLVWSQMHEKSSS